MLIVDKNEVRKIDLEDTSKIERDLGRVQKRTGLDIDLIFSNTIYIVKGDIYITFIPERYEIHISSNYNKELMPLSSDLIVEITENRKNKIELRDRYTNVFSRLYKDYYALEELVESHNNMIILDWDIKDGLLFKLISNSKMYLELNEDLYSSIRNWNVNKELLEYAHSLVSLIMSQLALKISAE